LVWVERNGDTSAVTEERRPYSSLSLSPGGERVAVEIGDENREIWIYELERESWRRVTFEKDSKSPVWSPDVRTLAFSSNRNGNFNVFSIPADGSDDARQLTHGNRWTFPRSWTPDGKRILVRVSDPASWFDILSLSLEGEPGLDPVVATPFHDINPALSPDGRWLAYASNESGSFEIYVRAASGSGQKWLVSQKGGTSPVWSPTGKELFYRHGDKMMAILVKTEGEFKAGVPEFLFEGFFSSNYAVAPDGQRFLMIEESEPIPLLEIVVVPNWFEELERLVDSTNEH